jgi:endonuclease/exonuclease/phosphatase family metal-dependent hydrolase
VSDLASASAALKAQLQRFATRREWLASPGGPALDAEVRRHLDLVRRFEPQRDSARPAGPLHVVHWNVLHGETFDAVARALGEEPLLRGADLVSLNEVDLGHPRSGTRDVAFEIAATLGLHAAWTPLFLELDPGRESMFGLALLSRFPLGQVRRVPLPGPEALLFDRERRVGGFVGLVAEVQAPETPFTAVVTHLDVHGGPADRLAQMQTLLAAAPPGPAILCGDLNTTTFARGGVRRAARTLATLACAPRERLESRLHAPHLPIGDAREPLFDLLRASGFRVDELNGGGPTLDLRFRDVHELDGLPPAARRAVLALLRPVERRGAMRLDWIAARGFEPLPEFPPFALLHLARGPAAASDHAPIGCKVALSAPRSG